MAGLVPYGGCSGDWFPCLFWLPELLACLGLWPFLTLFLLFFCFWPLLWPFFIPLKKTLCLPVPLGNPGSSPYLKSFNLNTSAKSFLSCKVTHSQLPGLGQGHIWGPLFCPQTRSSTVQDCLLKDLSNRPHDLPIY